jgi:PDZ domain-containing protein
VLSVGETVKAVDGVPTPDECAFISALHGKHPGQRVRLSIEKSTVSADAELINGPIVTSSVRLARAPDDLEESGCPGVKGPSKVYLGVAVETREDFTFPFPVSISTQNIGGPSAGLAMTLGLIDKLSGGSLTGGLSVAATGTIDGVGDVCEVGGVPQKTIAVERAGATVFLVPPGNYQDALSKATPQLHVYAVSTLNQALAVLRRLGGHVPPLPRSDPTAGAGISGGCTGQ